MTLRQMQYFAAVFEEGGFSRAAERENGTQSGLSQQIRNLEERLGLQLFTRTPHGVEPTAAGREYYARCVTVLRAANAAEQHMAELRGHLSGTIKAGLIPSLTKGALARVLTRFTEANPQVQVHIIEAYSQPLTDQVVAGDIDFAIVPVLPVQHVPGLSVRVLAREPELLLSGPALGLPTMQPIPARRLAGLKLVLPSPENSRRPYLESQLERVGTGPLRIMDMDGMTSTFEFVAESDWATILPVTACLGELAGGRLSLNPITEPEIPFDFILIEPRRKPLSPAAALFVAAIEARLAEIAVEWQRVTAQYAVAGN